MYNFVQMYPNVELPDDALIDEFVVLGKPPRNTSPGEYPLTFGSGCVIRSHSVIYAGNVIGENFQTGHSVNIREHNTIGHNVSIGTHSVIEHHVQIGNYVRLHTKVFVPEYSILEDHCWLGPGVIVTNALYPVSEGVKDSLQGAHIEEGAIVGAGAVILPGVRIGKKALIGAGAIVTKDVAPGEVVAGNPAKVINHINNIEAYTQ